MRTYYRLTFRLPNKSREMFHHDYSAKSEEEAKENLQRIFPAMEKIVSVVHVTDAENLKGRTQ